jgi:clan AA aspartic protease (TIGR02281 family)
MANLHIVNLLWFLHCFAAPSPAVTPGDAAAVRFDVDEDGAVAVAALVNGAGPFRFLVDTGSSHTAVGDALARRLGLQPVAKAEIMSATGHSMRPVVRLERTAVGSAAREGILASVLPSAELNGLASDVDGVLGQDFLADFDYTLDYLHGRLTWTSDGEMTEPAARLTLAPEGGRFLATLPQGAGRGVVRLVPDTGSAALVIFGRGGGGGTLRLLPASGQGRLRGVAGERTVERAFVQALRVGGLVMNNEPAVVVDRPGSAAGRADGLLPLHRFARVSFNARERCLLIWGR